MVIVGRDIVVRDGSIVRVRVIVVRVIIRVRDVIVCVVIFDRAMIDRGVMVFVVSVRMFVGVVVVVV